MPNFRYTENLSLEGGVFLNTLESITTDSAIDHRPDEPVPAAQAGSLTTRTTDTTGVVTISGHGIADTETIAIFWSGGSRYNVDIDSVTTDTITFSGGDGDNLPVQDTAVTVGVGIELDIAFNTANMEVFGVQCTTASVASRMAVSFLTSADSDLYTLDGTSINWTTGSGYTNPVSTGLVAKVNAYNAVATAGVVKIMVGYNND